MLKKLQKEQKSWVKHNFLPRAGNFTPELIESVVPLLGIMEEVGELAHAHLKQGQKIRTNEDHIGLTKDAIGDIVIYLADYCTARGFDLEEIVKEIWMQVKARDWKENPETGRA